MEEPTVTRINDGSCAWAMTDRDGYQYPHGVKARTQVTGAGELLNGVYCAAHADMALMWARQGIEPEL